MLKESIVKAISKQVNMEFHSAYLYLAMSSYCDKLGYKGFSNWLHIQSQEEMAHGMHMYEYILRNGQQPQFADIKMPPSEFGSILDVFKEVLKAEQSVTEKINNIAALAMEEGDHTTYGFIQWFLNEQIEEEESASLVVQKLELIGDSMGLIFTFDKKMETRTFVDPFAGQADA